MMKSIKIRSIERDSIGGKMFRRIIIVTAMVMLFSVSAATAGDPGTSGFVFLRLGNGARASGMGEAYTAVSDDATSIYWNPAGLASVEGVQLNVTHSEWLLDIRLEQVSIADEFYGGVVGLGFTGVYYGEFDRYGDTPSLTPDGTFAPYDLALSLGYARDIIPNLSAGIAAKLIYEKIDFESATGYALDLGISHRSKIEGLTLAASMLNLGPQAKFVEEQFYPPFQMRFGASHLTEKEWLRGSLIVAADAVFPNDSGSKFHTGLEYLYHNLLAVRFGYKSGYHVQGSSMGFGIIYRNLRFDYSYAAIADDLGDVHRFSINLFPSL
ncbi:MAG: PorV/PorQ family protein [Candidatus Krumholzibacteriota bacterium]|nr:PorV/PorQ family protein [Candidatus Krumholzibacteriota bacterium]